MSGNGSGGHIQFTTEGEDITAWVNAHGYQGGPQFRVDIAEGEFEDGINLTPQMALILGEAALAFAKRHGVKP